MAGVGFELKKLFRARTAVGHVKAYAYASVVTTGPFLLMTGMVLAVQLLFSAHGVAAEDAMLFVASVAYVFVFSQLLSSGFVMVLTRYLADCLSVGHYRDVTASLFGMGALLTLLGSAVAAVFFAASPLGFAEAGLTYVFFLELLLIWTQSVYLTAIKKFQRLITGFAASVSLSVALCAGLLAEGRPAPVRAALLSMDVGMGLLVCLFFVHIVQCFGLPRDGQHFAFLPYFERHWRLFFSAVFYTMGIFLPNFLVWLGPWGVTVAGTYRCAPGYDAVTFFAFLSILPLMVLFVVAAETRFYEKYAAYFDAITRRGNLREIQDARRELIYTLWFELRQVVEFQFVFTLVFLALGGYILSLTGVDYHLVSLYDVLLFAVFFTGILQLLVVLLTYFDIQKFVLRAAAIFLAANAVFGVLGFLLLGTAGYGFTFFLAAGLGLAAGWRYLSQFARRIDYYVYCAQPVFYRPPQGVLTRLTRWLYGARYVDLERGQEP
ncbi:exopolysaccharide Pel transporter PelG [Selenomonas bovis]|uniref:exopolysaccharide Pel transporter PelG n=1 Tax=Selenomonas bovis TaxID=416586 RepID=UPI003CFD8298